MSQNVQSEVNFTIANEEMILLSEKAIILPAHNTLLVSDLHFGKITHFRKNGIGLPPNAAKQDIAMLADLIKKIKPQSVIFLGDLFHSEYNDSWVSFKSMLDLFPDVAFHLVMGNHDILDERMYDGLNVTFQMEINDLVLTHEPMDVVIDDKYNLCGHIHPGVRLKGSAKQSLRIPCFFFGQRTGILPSFGTFTGTHVLKPIKGDQVFVVKDDLVIQVN